MYQHDLCLHLLARWVKNNEQKFASIYNSPWQTLCPYKNGVQCQMGSTHRGWVCNYSMHTYIMHMVSLAIIIPFLSRTKSIWIKLQWIIKVLRIALWTVCYCLQLQKKTIQIISEIVFLNIALDPASIFFSQVSMLTRHRALKSILGT